MKIEYLEIKNYKQFSDLKLNLTYPKGHEKEGQPLDKICIIGQSGTGKTNLLEIIKKSVIDFSEQPRNSYLPFIEFMDSEIKNLNKYIINRYRTKNDIQIKTLFTLKKSKIETIYDNKIKTLIHEKNYFIDTNKENIFIENRNSTEMPKKDKERIRELENAISDILIDTQGRHYEQEEELSVLGSQIVKIQDRHTINQSIKESLSDLKVQNFINKNIINIDEEDNSWELLKKRIDNRKEEETRYDSILLKKIMSNTEYAKQAKKDKENWEKENENILEKIADDINSIIKNFNLELKIDEDTNSYEELIIKDLSNNKIIEYDNLSTGTKNLLSTFIPLKSYNPKDSIILIDEPENSFYPDIQRELTDLYMGVGENNQLIMATHSPLIASSFEPWEVVELKFDKNNQIYRENYYEGENHIDNYTLDPRMLTWTSILVDIFDLKEDSFSLREKKLMEYGMLKSEIKAMEKGIERDEKIKKFKKLSALLGLQN